VKQCGGLISVWSTLGKGTTVDVFLPALPETAEAREPEEPNETVGIKTVNLVESAEVVDSVHRLRRVRVTLSSAVLVLTLAALMGTLGDASKPRLAIQPPGEAIAGAWSGTALGFTARFEGNELLLSWDWEAVPIKTADRAVLSITDGSQREDVELDPVVLRTKRLLYSPLTNDVSFRLQVANFKRKTTASESVRVLARRPSRLAVPAQEHPQSPARSVLP
jgi:hypothetical protein